MSTYRLFVYAGRRWRWIADVEAADHAEAFRQAMLELPRDDYDKPVQIVRVDGGLAPAPAEFLPDAPPPHA